MHFRTILSIIVPILGFVAANPIAAPADIAAAMDIEKRSVCSGWCGGGTVSLLTSGTVPVVRACTEADVVHSASGTVRVPVALTLGPAAKVLSCLKGLVKHERLGTD
jgi:hypothetical protein